MKSAVAKIFKPRTRFNIVLMFLMFQATYLKSQRLYLLHLDVILMEKQISFQSKRRQHYFSLSYADKGVTPLLL